MHTTNKPNQIHIPWWLPILLIALALRLIVLASNTVSFHSDEAIVGLMARHINLGKPIPTFFYGQPYMGSLDPLLVSLVFRITGESVLGIRLVQSALYLGMVASTLALTLRLFRDRTTAVLAGLLIALPPVLVTLYTTISLGGYGETLLIGNLLLLVGYSIYDGCWQSRRHWLALGALAGLGWWTNNLIVAYALPVAILLLSNWRKLPWKMLGFATVTFLIFSAPWWIYNLTHDWESVRFLLGGFVQPQQRIGPGDKLIGLVMLGLPALIGIRYSWLLEYWPGAASILVVVVYAILLIPTLILAVRSSGPLRFLWIMLVTFSAIFVVSSFGIDATGRYLLPLFVPLMILVAAQIRRMASRYRWLVAAVLVLLLVNLAGTIRAMQTLPPGLTPQFDPATDFPNTDDQAVIEFLKAHESTRGYGTYWVSYRLSFISGESVILSPQLPYKASLQYFDVDRYPAYTDLVRSAPNPAYVTANLPQLDQAIIDRLEARNISYSVQKIGPFTIFYDLSTPITPAELGVQSILHN